MADESASPATVVPPPDELRFVLTIPPVSIQAGKVKKDALAAEVHKQTEALPYILTGDFKFDVQWRIHEQQRYETDRTPDTDNILKPLIDAFCGPKGVLIDDCQAQEVSLRWIDWTLLGQEIDVRIRYDSDEWMPKAGLKFVHFGKALCYPVAGGLSVESEQHLLQSLVFMLKSRDEFIAEGADYHTARSVMSVQRVFHRSRVSRFPVHELSAVLGAQGTTSP
jgi:Holliday junction resolvase RusA-like endonuclease